MGITSSGSLLTAFRPTDIVTRAELAAVLSRMLYGNTYDNIHNENEAWYVPHLQALSTAGYIKDITTPFMTERV